MDSSLEYEYLDLLMEILHEGEDSMDRTGTGTRSLFGRQMRFDLSKGFPAITTKKLAWKSMVGELLWFLEGSGDEGRLSELTHGVRGKKTIWTDNANAPYWKPNAQFEGDLGRVYGVQWRRWQRIKFVNGPLFNNVKHEDGSTTVFQTKVNVKEYDQIAMIVDSLKNNPKNRRMVLTAFNVGEIEEMALPPCHMFAQFHVSERTRKLNCQVYIRSNDMFLGCPFNIASYALLVHMLAHVTGWNPGELIVTIGDAHIYHNHFDQVREQISRVPYAAPELRIKRKVESIDDFKFDDFELVGYDHYPELKAPMAV